MCAPAMPIFDEFTPDMIIELVSIWYQVPMTQLKSVQRAQHVAFVRQIAMYLLRECTALSFLDIGDLFHRDHSTVIYGYNQIARRMAKGSPFAALVEGLKKDCRTALRK